MPEVLRDYGDLLQSNGSRVFALFVALVLLASGAAGLYAVGAVVQHVLRWWSRVRVAHRRQRPRGTSRDALR